MEWRHNVETAQSLVNLYQRLGDMPQPFNVIVSSGLHKPRTRSQNALIHMWFGEIAKQTHETADQVKRECKFYQGCPILMAEDPAFAAFVANLGHLTIEQKIASMDYVAVTSVMDTAQLKRMCDAVARKYRTQGLTLTDPDARKYEDAA